MRVTGKSIKVSVEQLAKSKPDGVMVLLGVLIAAWALKPRPEYRLQ